jgi:hypothetical protein
MKSLGEAGLPHRQHHIEIHVVVVFRPGCFVVTPKRMPSSHEKQSIKLFSLFFFFFFFIPTVVFLGSRRIDEKLQHNTHSYCRVGSERNFSNISLSFSGGIERKRNKKKRLGV